MVTLPSEYQEVEYIESTGTQYIELPFGFLDTDEIEIVGVELSKGTDKYMISPSVWNNDSNRFAMVGQYDFLTIGFGDLGTRTARFSPHTTSNGEVYTWTYKNREFSIVEIGLTRDVSQSTFNAETNYLRIFYGYNSPSRGRIYSFKQTKQNGSALHLIPCYRKSDSEIGMFDLVSGMFYTNAGTGTFLKGGDVSHDCPNMLDLRRRILLTTPHLETASGTVASFSTDLRSNLKECKIHFSPIQSGTGDPSPSNVRPISGWDGVTVERSSEMHRLIPEDFQTVTYNGLTREYLGNGKYRVYGTLTATYTTSAISFTPFTCPSADGRMLRFFNSIAIGSDTNDFGLAFYNGNTLVERWTFSSANRIAQNYNSMAGKQIDTFYLSFGRYMIGKYVDFTFQPDFVVSPESLTIPFPQTIYGGYVDLVKGEVVEDIGFLEVDENTTIKSSANRASAYAVSYSLPLTGANNNLLAWSHGTIRDRNSAALNYPTKDKASLDPYNKLTTSVQIGATDGITTLQEWEDWLAENQPLQFVYELATPVVYTISPVILKALKGQNKLWSNANDNIEVKFWTH